MGDTPSLLYLMDGDPANLGRQSWGGSFDKTTYSSHVVFDRTTSTADTVAFCTVVEFHLQGPNVQLLADSVCFWLETPYKQTVQKWAGYYLGNGHYGLKYVPKQAETVSYRLTSAIPGFPVQEGKLVVTNPWPGKHHATDYALGTNWYTDQASPQLYDGKIQGGKTVSKWRQEVLLAWAKRWVWLH